jgi:hypothetical protein
MTTVTYSWAKRNGVASEYRSWSAMLYRCDNPDAKYHGALGVQVCKRWHKSFAVFLKDMGPKPTPKHSIDRYPNNDGDYKPSNCRWATAREQRLNQRPYDESARVAKAWESRSRVANNRQDLTGRKFNRLMVLRFSHVTNKLNFWVCQCDCGETKTVAGKGLRSSGVKSCGCLNREVARANAILRNKVNNPVRYRWQGR